MENTHGNIRLVKINPDNFDELYEPENVIARKLYQSFGFVEAKKTPEGWNEVPASLKL